MYPDEEETHMDRWWLTYLVASGLIISAFATWVMTREAPDSTRPIVVQPEMQPTENSWRPGDRR